MFGFLTNKRRIEFSDISRILEGIKVVKIRSCTGLFCTYFNLKDENLSYNEIMALISNSLGLRPNIISEFVEGEYREIGLNGEREYRLDLSFGRGFRRATIYGVNK
ncbi:hypothetical protein J4405_01950 [Candidatus Woesearchaeota archaeon]|nr:hypothetical protein [Candidatus Woesearchaeota archaeon]